MTRSYHDEFDSLFVDQIDDAQVPGPNMNYWLYENRSVVFFALRDYVARRKAKEATSAAMKEARDAIDAAAKTFAGKFE